MSGSRLAAYTRLLGLISIFAALGGCGSPTGAADTGNSPDAFHADGGVDASTADATIDAALPMDAAAEDAAMDDAGIDAAVEVDAFVEADAFVEVDAFAEPDAFVAPDAFTFPDAAFAGGCGMLISEIRTRGAMGASDEFVELYNGTPAPIVLDSSWRLQARSNTAGTYTVRWTGTGITVPPLGHFLIVGSMYSGTTPGDATFTNGPTDAASVVLLQYDLRRDAVCFAYDATSAAPFADATFVCEGMPVTNPHNNTTATNVDVSIERAPGGLFGSCADTSSSAADFASRAPSEPQSTTSPSTPLT